MQCSHLYNNNVESTEGKGTLESSFEKSELRLPDIYINIKIRSLIGETSENFTNILHIRAGH